MSGLMLTSMRSMQRTPAGRRAHTATRIHSAAERTLLAAGKAISSRSRVGGAGTASTTG